MSNLSTPENGDFASYVEQLSQESLKRILKEAQMSKSEHERHATGEDLNAAEDASSKKKKDTQNIDKGTASSKRKPDNVKAHYKKADNQIHSNQPKTDTSEGPEKHSCMENKPPFFVKAQNIICLIALFVYYATKNEYISEETFIDYVPMACIVLVQLFFFITNAFRVFLTFAAVCLCIFNINLIIDGDTETVYNMSTAIMLITVAVISILFFTKRKRK